MVEKLQCPVCTLFLHTGMNLSDHLETHPKEQVIQALVQMTVKRTESDVSADNKECILEDLKKRDVESSALTGSFNTVKEPEVDTKSINDTSSPLTCEIDTRQVKQDPNAASIAEPVSPSSKHVFNKQNGSSSPTYLKNIGAVNLIAGVSNNISLGDNEAISQKPTDFSTFPNRYQNHQQSASQNNQQHLQQNHVPTTQRRTMNTLLEATQHIEQHTPGFYTKHHHQHRQQLQLLTPIHAQQHRMPLPLPFTQQSKLNVIYSPTLPSQPPQLQPFNYQTSTQLHQKPPPAYCTAISQIRSQHNQNKHQLMQRTGEAQAAKQYVEKKSVTPLSHAASPQKHNSQQKNETVHLHQEFTKNVVSNATSTILPKFVAYHQSNVQPQTPAAPLPPPPPTCEPSTLIIPAQPVHSRATHSPYPAILSAAVGASPSCSSVLRFAESPVTAHYLERDNGDFIVQETPKHIVECVEKDNGEFSVIERIYQSPPSVLRIHDEEDDEDDDKDKEVLEVAGKDKAIVKEKNAKEQPNTKKNNTHIDPDTEEEFMSIDGDSDTEDSSSGKPLPDDRERKLKESTAKDVCVEKPTLCSTAEVECSQNTTNTNAGVNSVNIVRKKSSKNTITVLSDVQLNLNEYLDLVGNIIASSKIAKNQSNGAAIPIPLVKVEKVEPMDEYESEEQQCPSPVGGEEKLTTAAETKKPSAASLREPPIETTTNKDNITETDELVANINSDKPAATENPSTNKTEIDSNLNKQRNVVNATYSSHATTSVIRMATTITSQQHPQQHPAEKQPVNNDHSSDDLELTKASDRLKNVVLNSSDAGDSSSETQIIHEVVSNQSVSVTSLQPQLKKGPKKLIIKPKATANEAKIVKDSQAFCEEKPTTCGRAKKFENDQDKHGPTHKNVVIKNEPNITIEATRILEQHLNFSTHTFEPKQEKSSRHDTLAEFKQEIMKFNIKRENDEPNHSSKVTAEARITKSTPLLLDEETRVLMEFADSNKKEVPDIPSSANTSFLSANSIFGVASAEKMLLSSTSNSTSSLATATSITSCNALATLRCEDEFIVPDATDEVQEIIISSCYSSQSASDVALNNCNNVADASDSHHQQHHHNFSDYPFSFLYGGGSVAQEVAAKSHFSPIYQQQQHDATTAATLASGSNSATIDEFTLDHPHRNPTPSRYHHHNAPPARQWYQSVSTSNTDFDTALAVDCGGIEGGDAGNYLDLDSYKRVNMNGGAQTVVGPSSSLSSFTAATESSLAGCTADALNIRTDEKMPAKGEISEQESNCDIENSWSQSMYGDIPVRFFKSSFPGLFPPENCWNNDEYFTVQDLSASTGTTNISNRATKSFDFRLPLDNAGTSSSTAGSNTLQQHSDAVPSTSSKKKRKRDSNIAKNSVLTKPIAATVTSHDLLLQEPQQQQPLPQQQGQQLHVYHDEPSTTSAAILAGPSTAAAAASKVATTQPQSRVGKVFSCVHCLAKFSRLKDRNVHMIAQHNYVLRNYRLVPMQKVVTATATMAKTTFVPATIADMDVSSAGASCSSKILLDQHQNLEQQEDSKQGIVKIELEAAENAISNRIPPAVDGVGHILAKSELDENQGLALANNVVAAVNESADPVFLPSLTRLYNLYHMLVSFNIAALKQNQTLTEADEKLMLTSIFFCFICRQKFATVKLYDAHMTEHPAECYTCGKKFHRWQNLSLHLKRHLGWKEFGCSICDKKFVVRSALVEHMRMHTGQKPLKCNICGKHFKRFSNLAQHRKRHGKQIIRKKEFVCHCGEVLPSKARFLWHKETHDAKPKCCPYCCDRFVHANSLRRHIRLAHSDKFDYTEPMECPMCKQVFAKSSIRAHMATHSMDMQHVCPICSKSFSTKWNLKIHSWVHANRTAKPFKCEHCPKAFVREVDFKNHMNAHKQIKPYTCEYCGCKFIRKYNYMRHRREHHGNKKFTCDLCKKSFHRHYYLIEHRRIHTGERPFQCTICGKSSTTKTNHNKHLKIHHSRDPFTVEA